MKKLKDILTVYIGNEDVENWSSELGHEIIISELIRGYQTLIRDSIDSLVFLIVNSDTRKGKLKTYDFIMFPDHMTSTLNKMLEWAIENEEYEKCAQIIKLKEMNKLK